MKALDYAINMEIDGERYYTEQAVLNQDNAVGIVCRILAEAERGHEQLLMNKANSLPYTLPEVDQDKEMQSFFRRIGDFRSDIQETPKQLDFYRTALELEQQSIDLYERLLGETNDLEEKELFLYLIDWEKQHYALLDTLVTMLRHAEEWVESAEFGLRQEEY